MQGLATLSTLDRILFLRRVPIFAMLPPPDLAQVARLATEHTFTDGATVARQGEPGERLHVIVSGAIPEGPGASAGWASAWPDGADNGGLTRRETEVLAEIAAGLSNSEIAAKLFISDTTVKTHVNHLLVKTGMRDRAQLVGYAYRLGLTR